MKESEKTDHLLRLISKDDTKAFELLFHQYHKSIYAFCIKLLSSGDDAEEIVQNVFMAIWNQRKNLKISGSFTAYLFGIARHMVYEYIQRRIKQQAFEQYIIDHNNEYSFITEEEIFFQELNKTLQELINQLPGRRREIFILNRFEGLSYKEISEKLGISENTVDTQIRYAIAFLRTRLNDR